MSDGGAIGGAADGAWSRKWRPWRGCSRDGGATEFEAVVLDVMRRDRGFETCRRLRQDGVWARSYAPPGRDRGPGAGLDEGAADTISISAVRAAGRMRASRRRSPVERPAVREGAIAPGRHPSRWRGTRRSCSRQGSTHGDFMRRPGEVLNGSSFASGPGLRLRTARTCRGLVRYLRQKSTTLWREGARNVRGLGYRAQRRGSCLSSAIPIGRG